MNEWLHRRTRVVVLAGQSRRWDSALSPVQLAFLEAIAPADAIVRCGFPFRRLTIDARAPAHLLAAAQRSALIYAQARWDRAFAACTAQNLQPLIDSTERFLIVTGSAGLAILNAAWPLLGYRTRISVLSFGPVGRAITGTRFSAVRGIRDGWSRALYRGPTTHTIACAHMGYWASEEARAIANTFATEVFA